MRKRIPNDHKAPAASTRKRTPARPAPPPARTDRLGLLLESEDPNLLDKETAKLYQRLRESGAQIHGPVPLPVRRPEGGPPAAGDPAPRVHRRLFRILLPKQATVALLEKLPLSGAVSALVRVEEEQEASAAWPDET